MYSLNDIDRLVAETAALRVVTQRVLYQLAGHYGERQEILRQAHAQALDDLSRIEFVGASPQKAEALQAHAQHVLDEIHTTIRPNPPAPQS